jgi:ribosomal protein S18 acetylase RimI-like enzyme
MTAPAIRYDDSQKPTKEQLASLYNALEWYAYTTGDQAASLIDAISNSTYVLCAWDKEMLVGLVRCLTDDVSIFYLQDILVRPEYQRQGIGSALMETCMKRYNHVRTKVLMTDDEEKQKLFYESAGYRNIQDIDGPPLNVFVKFRK